jgi:penicillin-binding protein 1C
MTPAATAIVADILSDRNARAVTFGIDSLLAGRTWSAVKTGTSKDMRDNWCVGFTGRYTVGVWVGNSSGEPMWDVSGTTGAAPIWRALVDELGAHEGDAPRPVPAGVVRRAISFAGGLEASRDELFIAGTESQRITPGARPRGGAIVLPVDGSVVAIDPDIPPQRQRLSFRRADDPASHRAEWRLDGRIIGRGAVMQWPVWPGRHVLELVAHGDSPLDRVVFEVRGATLRAP